MTSEPKTVRRLPTRTSYGNPKITDLRKTIVHDKTVGLFIRMLMRKSSLSAIRLRSKKNAIAGVVEIAATYCWYRSSDQPALLNADLTPAEREQMQTKAGKWHRAWTKEGEDRAPPTVGRLASAARPAE